MHTHIYIFYVYIYTQVEKIYPPSITNMEELDDEFELDLKIKLMINMYNKVPPQLSY